MIDLPAFATCPTHVRAVDFGHVLVCINYRQGRVQALRPPAVAQWDVASRTGALEAMDPALVRRLLALGLLVPVSGPVPWPCAPQAAAAQADWGSTEHPAGISRPRCGSLGETLAAAAALAVAFAVTRWGRTGMWHAIELVSACAAWAVRPATAEQATRAVGAVRRAGWYFPGRSACLEESVAAVLLLGTRRLGVRWCHGVASDPIRLHAWVQTEGGADIGEPDSTRVFVPVLTLGGRHHQSR